MPMRKSRADAGIGDSKWALNSLGSQLSLKQERSDRNEDEAQRGEPPMSITRLRHVEDFLEPHAPHTL